MLYADVRPVIHGNIFPFRVPSTKNCGLDIGRMVFGIGFLDNLARLAAVRNLLAGQPEPYARR